MKALIRFALDVVIALGLGGLGVLAVVGAMAISTAGLPDVLGQWLATWCTGLLAPGCFMPNAFAQMLVGLTAGLVVVACTAAWWLWPYELPTIWRVAEQAEEALDGED